MNDELLLIIEKQILTICYPFFLEGMRVQMLIDRSIGNTNKGSKRWVNKLISYDSTQFIENCRKLLEQMYYFGNPDIRLYSCVNNRYQTKAINRFQHLI